MPNQLVAPIYQDARPTESGSVDTRPPRFLELLSATAADLLEAHDMAKALDRLFAMIRTELKLDVFFHYSYQSDLELDLVAHGGLALDQAAASVRLGEAVCGSVAKMRQAIVASNLQRSNDPRDAFLKRMGIEAYICTPLIHAGELLGTLGFGRRASAAFDEAEIRFIQTLCSYVALAKHHINVDAELRVRIAERERLLAERVEMERKVLELTRASALGAVAATVAHELNQPLSAAVNYLAAIRLSGDISARTRELTEWAEAQLQRAGEIIRRIRRMVRHNDMVLEYRSLEPVIGESIALVRAAAMGRSLPPILVEIGNGATHARFDHVQVVQVLANLLRNAMQATSGTKDARIMVSTSAPRPHEIEIRVADNGPGVAPALLPSLFQAGLASAHQGLGLGLAISQSLIEGHGGRIWFADTPGGGATFCFTLPNNA